MNEGKTTLSVGWRGLCDCDHIAQSGDPLDMDRPSLRRRTVLLAPDRRAQDVAHLIVSPTEAGGTVGGLEAGHLSREVILYVSPAPPDKRGRRLTELSG